MIIQILRLFWMDYLILKKCRDSVLHEWFPQSPRIIGICDLLLHASSTMQLVCGRKVRSLLASKRMNAAELGRIFLALVAGETRRKAKAKKWVRDQFSRINFSAIADRFWLRLHRLL